MVARGMPVAGSFLVGGGDDSMVKLRVPMPFSGSAPGAKGSSPPGANPENGIDTHGMVASMLSVGKLDYNDALDGISLTNTITRSGAWAAPAEEQIQNSGPRRHFVPTIPAPTTANSQGLLIHHRRGSMRHPY